MSMPDCGFFAMNAPAAFAVASVFAAASLSASDRPCAGAALSPAKMLARPTTAAEAGLASGTLMISMRKRDEFGSSAATSAQPASSPAERMPDEPDT